MHIGMGMKYLYTDHSVVLEMLSEVEYISDSGTNKTFSSDLWGIYCPGKDLYLGNTQMHWNSFLFCPPSD